MGIDDLPRVRLSYPPARMDAAARAAFKRRRKALKLNQTQVAQKAGVEQGTISKIEADPAYEPSVTVFQQALHGLDLTMSAFFRQLETLSRESEADVQTSGAAREPHSAPAAESTVADDARALPSPVLIDAEGLVALGHAIGRAIRTAARDQQAPSARPRRPKARPRAAGHH